MSYDGPSARQVQNQSEGAYSLVDLDYRVSQIVAANPARPLTTLAGASSRAPIDLIGQGDVIAVSIYEAGSAPLLAGNRSSAGGGEPQSLHLAIGREGMVHIPFAGEVAVAGLTPAQASSRIEAALRGRALNPQVLVAVATNVANTVTVIGDVRKAGRFPLTAGGDRLLDVLASAGGATKPAADVTVTVVRGSHIASAPLSALMSHPAENIRLAPHDQVRVTHKPRKFNTFGAVAKASQIAIEDETLTLAGALSRLGGLDGDSANAASVLLFRFERPEVARALGLQAGETSKGVPVIYRANLRDPQGYFLANTFQVQADDLIYVPRSDVAEMRKFFDLTRSITQVAYDLTVATVIP